MFTWVEIDEGAIKYNLNQFRKYIGPQKLLMPVIKSNAYGHGFKEVAKICEKHTAVDRMCVVSLDEALELLQIKPKKPIFILSFYELNESKLKVAIKQGVIFTLYTLEQASFLNKIGTTLKKRVVVHLKIDTGTSRVGILPAEALAFVKKIKTFPYLDLEGLWTHFASSEEDKKYTFEQLEKLKKIDQELKEQGIVIPLKHSACTASTILYEQTHLDGVRVGLGIYGLHPSEKTKQKINLKPVLRLYTKIVQLKKVPQGTKVGYGGTWVTPAPTTLAIIPVGYFDGYDRKFSNQGTVVIKNHPCPIRGRICMNLTMVDVTKVKNLKVGDVVTIIGPQNPAEMLARKINTINYEIVTRINPLIPRIFN